MVDTQLPVVFGDNVLAGGDMSDDEALEYAVKMFPDGHFCIVRDWLLADLDESRGQLKRAGKGSSCVLLYAGTIVYDEQNRWRPGAFIKTSPLVTLQDGFIFQTRNTAYLLLGLGLKMGGGKKPVRVH